MPDNKEKVQIPNIVKIKNKGKTVGRPSKLELQASKVANYILMKQKEKLDEHIINTVLYWESEIELP